MSCTNKADASQGPDSYIPFDMPHQQNGDIDDEDARHKKLLEECDKELYPGCKYSNLSFNLHLYLLKGLGAMSNKVFAMLLEFPKDAFPQLALLPSTTYKAKKLTTDLGLDYEKNSCMS